MNKEAKEQYMETLREQYLKAGKKEKGHILDEYCRNTNMERKYAIKKFSNKVKTKRKGERKPRVQYYDSAVKVALVRMWEIFDYPCGQRLETLLKKETERLVRQSELICSQETVEKLKKMTSATIDRKLVHEKEVRMLAYRHSKRSPLFCHSVPTKTSSEFDRNLLGQIQIDFVEHCGSSVSGEYVNSLSCVDVSSGWWEGEAVMGKGQERALDGIKNTRERMPFNWLEMHPDNGSNIMNYHVYEYAQKEKLQFTRSRPYKKNDNCFVEQKNSTHVRKIVGYLRYDSQKEFDLMNELYRGDLRLFKNFFQPIIKLFSKERINGKIHKKYSTSKTPYHRIIESNQIGEKQKRSLKKIYESLNPAELKRSIEEKQKMLYKLYQKKKGSRTVAANRKLTPSLVSSFMMRLK